MKTHLPFLVSFLLIFNYFEAKAQQKMDTTTTLYKKLDTYLNTLARAEKFTGSALVAKRGQIILHKGYGLKNYLTRVPNDTNSIFPIGSLTKSFTAIMILKLQEEGKLSVNDRLSKYIPEQKGAEHITIQNLLDHTSGLYDFSHDIPEDDSTLLSHPIPRQTILNAFINKAPEFKPGTKYSYCSSDYYLLGMIIEQVSGMPYEQFVRKNIFEPLGMRHSGFDFINLRDTSKATGYKSYQPGKYELAVKWDSTLSRASGAIYSTTGDLYKWARAIAKKQILNKASWDEAFTPHLENYGDGFWIDTLYGNRYVYHSGGLLGFMSSFRYYPDQDVTVILQSNYGFYWQSLLQFNNTLSAIMFGKASTLLSGHTIISVDESILKTYTGTYSANGKDKVFITLDNHQLYAESNSKNGIPKLPVYAESESSFFLKDFDGTLTFVKDEHNKVIKLMSHENGKEVELRKIK